MYPRVAALPWLNRFWLRLIAGWFAFAVLLGAVAYGFILRATKAIPIRRWHTCWLSRW